MKKVYVVLHTVFQEIDLEDVGVVGVYNKDDADKIKDTFVDGNTIIYESHLLDAGEIEI